LSNYISTAVYLISNNASHTFRAANNIAISIIISTDIIIIFCHLKERAIRESIVIVGCVRGVVDIVVICADSAIQKIE